MFLKGVESKEISENEALGRDSALTDAEEEMSDTEMVKQMLDLCFKNIVENSEERKRRRRTITKIKQLLAEYQEAAPDNY